MDELTAELSELQEQRGPVAPAPAPAFNDAEFMATLFGFPNMAAPAVLPRRARRRQNMMTNMVMMLGLGDNLFDMMGPDPDELMLREAMERSLSEYAMSKKDITVEIKTLKYKDLDVKQKEENKMCSICRDDYDDNEQVTIVDCCKAVFHEDCIREWGKYKPMCPLCRKEIPHKSNE